MSFPGSSMAERFAVNEDVVRSSRTRGANLSLEIVIFNLKNPD
jgi:hypothetical protein